MEIKEIRLKYPEDVRDEMWHQKEVLQKKYNKTISWENFFKYLAGIK